MVKLRPLISPRSGLTSNPDVRPPHSSSDAHVVVELCPKEGHVPGNQMLARREIRSVGCRFRGQVKISIDHLKSCARAVS